jgi:Flp pilus assembly protein TadG
MTRRRHHRARGQTLVEFTLILPVFLLVLFGILDAGRLVYMNTVLSQAAREGARVASVEASWIGSSDASCNTTGGPKCPATSTALRSDITSAANRMVTPFGPVTQVYVRCDPPASAPTGSWTDQTCGSNAATDIVSVRVVLTFNPITPVIGQIIGSIPLSGAATMVIN